jgi:hypothetical protein
VRSVTGVALLEWSGLHAWQVMHSANWWIACAAIGRAPEEERPAAAGTGTGTRRWGWFVNGGLVAKGRRARLRPLYYY